MPALSASLAHYDSLRRPYFENALIKPSATASAGRHRTAGGTTPTGRDPAARVVSAALPELSVLVFAPNVQKNGKATVWGAFRHGKPGNTLSGQSSSG